MAYEDGVIIVTVIDGVADVAANPYGMAVKILDFDTQSETKCPGCFTDPVWEEEYEQTLQGESQCPHCFVPAATLQRFAP